MVALHNLALGLLRLAGITEITEPWNVSPPTEPESCRSSQPLPAQTDFDVPLWPSAIPDMVLFLAWDESRYVTGMQMRMDAGSYVELRATNGQP
ncbi:hypothetical protein [Parafrankia sp. FMc2]|uniref:hypothetical protein n=1 Tax=Parafrankia sp. FMc2 TaxID=3233196 RepID=UPI0034D59080